MTSELQTCHICLCMTPGDKRDNVLVVPEGCYVDVPMAHPYDTPLFFHIAFFDRCLSSPWSKLQAERIGDFKKVSHVWLISNLEGYACCSLELCTFVYKKNKGTNQQCVAVGFFLIKTASLRKSNSFKHCSDFLFS